MKKAAFTSQETAQFCKNVALLLHAGLPLADALYLLAQEETAIHRQEYEAMGSCLEQGSPLCEAMEERDCFPAYAVGMVRIGEQTGQLETALQALASFYEIRNHTENHLREVLTYPAALMAMMLAVIAILLVKVLPVFEDVYISLGSQLTGFSAVLLQLGRGLGKISPALLTAAVLILLAVLVICRVPSLRSRAVCLWMTHFGDRGIFRKFSNAQFAQALAMGFCCGLPLSQSMTLTQQLLAGSPGAAARIQKAGDRICQGVSMTTALLEAELLSGSGCRMLSVGLRSGSAESVMTGIAAAMMEEAQAAVDRKISRLEPAMVLVCSVLVGSILLSVMLPLMQVLSTIG